MHTYIPPTSSHARSPSQTSTNFTFCELKNCPQVSPGGSPGLPVAFRVLNALKLTGKTTPSAYVTLTWITVVECQFIARWWQLKYVLFSPRKFGEDEPILTSMFFSDGLVETKPPTRLELLVSLGRYSYLLSCFFVFLMLGRLGIWWRDWKSLKLSRKLRWWANPLRNS